VPTVVSDDHRTKEVIKESEGRKPNCSPTIVKAKVNKETSPGEKEGETKRGGRERGEGEMTIQSRVLLSSSEYVEPPGIPARWILIFLLTALRL
jgi:hypothetical protein